MPIKLLKIKRNLGYDFVLRSPEQKSRDSYFTVLGKEYGYKDIISFGIIISKRNIPKSSSRNRIKRIVRESLKAFTFFKEPLAIVIIAHSGVDNLSNKKIRESLIGNILKINS